jgi:hypothetical protein
VGGLRTADRTPHRRLPPKGRPRRKRSSTSSPPWECRSRWMAPAPATSPSSASVDSELALLYAKLKGVQLPRAGRRPQPLLHARDSSRSAIPRFPIYLVTRLAAYDLADVKAMIDRSLRPQSRQVRHRPAIPEKRSPATTGCAPPPCCCPPAAWSWTKPPRPLYNQKNVIGYASWGPTTITAPSAGSTSSGCPAPSPPSSSPPAPHLPASARRPGYSATDWDQSRYFGGYPQGLVADLIHEGATGVSGNVYEPLPRRLRPPRLPAPRLPPGPQPGRVLLPRPPLPELARRRPGRPVVRRQRGTFRKGKVS